MANIRLKGGDCVRASSKLASCTLCADICPAGAIAILQQLPIIDHTLCVGCGGCVGVCPTEAFELGDFDPVSFVFDCLESGESLISCKKNLPCLSALSVEHLVAFGLLSNEQVVMDTGHCAGCAIREPLFAKITQNIEEANRVLASMESPKRIEARNIGFEASCRQEKEVDRRDFLRRFGLKGAIKTKEEFERAVELSDPKSQRIGREEIESIKTKKIPDKRKLLYAAIKQTPKPRTFVPMEEPKISFVSDKEIGAGCDNCSLCYRLCPTGALASEKGGAKIVFDPLLCVKCRLCHDVCEPHAITLRPTVSTQEFFEPRARVLAAFTIRRCQECGNPFTYTQGDAVCPRCKILEEEALSLWGLG